MFVLDIREYTECFIKDGKSLRGDSISKRTNFFKEWMIGKQMQKHWRNWKSLHNLKLHFSCEHLGEKTTLKACKCDLRLNYRARIDRISAHKDIFGNELSGILTKEATSKTQNRPLPSTSN